MNKMSVKKPQILNTSHTVESDFYFSLENEITKKRNNESQNLEQFKLISSSVTSHFDKLLRNQEPTEDFTQYFSAPLHIKSESDRFKSATVNFQTEEIKIRKQIRDMKRKLNDILFRNQEMSDEVLSFRKTKETTEKALFVAKNHYSNIWDMNISIEESTENSFTCIINFRFAYGMYPIKFVIDRQTRNVLNWSASALLTSEEEDEMKRKLSGVNNCFPRILSDLRLLTLRKIKLS